MSILLCLSVHWSENYFRRHIWDKSRHKFLIKLDSRINQFFCRRTFFNVLHLSIWLSSLSVNRFSDFPLSLSTVCWKRILSSMKISSQCDLFTLDVHLTCDWIILMCKALTSESVTTFCTQGTWKNRINAFLYVHV